MNCLFCKIAAGELPANVIYQDNLVVAFDDIKPQAPHHKIIIPTKHIATLNDLEEDDKNLIGHIAIVASKLAAKLGIERDGYRLVINCNEHAGQTVFHIHAHLLGGRHLSWPPG